MALEGGPIRLTRTAFVIYYHIDFARARTFYLDFGLSIAAESATEIFFKGYGTEPFIYILRKATDGSTSSFGGAAYVVQDRSELERASRTIKGATTICLLHGPGGGEIVTLTDPSGFHVHLVYGQTPKAADSMPLEKLVVNYEDEKPRKGQFQRFKPGPAPVYRWGHYGVTYAPEVGYDVMYNWFTQVIGLAPSDLVHRDGKLTTCFFHIDRKQEYSDHHCFFFKPAKPGQRPSAAHAAFEVHDFDIQQMGHNYLESKGYELCWGIGRVSC